MGTYFPGPSPFRLHRPLDPLPGSVPRVALLAANYGNICPRFLRILRDGPDSFAFAGKPYGAHEPGFDPTDVSDAAGGGQRPSWPPGSGLSRRRVRPRRPDRNSF